MDDFLCSQFISYFSAPLFFSGNITQFSEFLPWSPVQSKMSPHSGIMFEFDRINLSFNEKLLPKKKILKIVVSQTRTEADIGSKSESWKSWLFSSKSTKRSQELIVQALSNWVLNIYYRLGRCWPSRRPDRHPGLLCAKRSLHCSTKIFTMQISFSEYWYS